MNEFSDSSTWKNPPPEDMKKFFTDAKTIAVVGLSSKADRPSNRVALYLKSHGFEIIPVNPRETEVFGNKAYPDLASIDRKIDVVDIFRRGEDTPPIVEEAIRCGARYIWLQEGIVSQDSFELAQKAGIPIVMNACMLKEHQRLRP